MILRLKTLNLLLEGDNMNFEYSVDWYQEKINNGYVWRLEGFHGRQAMDLIEGGYCTLGEKGCHDYWGNYVPSKTEVQAGTKGSQEYVDQKTAERDGE